MWIRFFLPLVFAGLLAGCSPSYNWRTVALAGGAVSTVLPGKPVTRARTLDFAGHNITLTFRSEEHTSELQSLMRNSYAVFCLKKTKYITIASRTQPK